MAVATGEPPGPSIEALADAALARVRNLCRELKIPARLREVKVQEADLERIAKKAFEDASHQSNPRPCGQADLLAIARAAF